MGYRRPRIAVLRDDSDVVRYLATDVGWPLRVDELVAGTELDVDAISDGNGWSVPGILEQLDRREVPGDSVAVLPPQALSRPMQERAAEAAGRIALALGVRGILNVQMIATADRIVVEANPRASRTVPIVAKATGRDVVAAAVRCALGASLVDVGLPEGLADGPLVAVKAPIGRSGASRASLRSSGQRCARRARCSAWRRRPTRRIGWRPRRLPRTAAERSGRPLGWPSPLRAGPVLGHEEGPPGSSTEGPGTRRPEKTPEAVSANEMEPREVASGPSFRRRRAPSEAWRCLNTPGVYVVQIASCMPVWGALRATACGGRRQ